VAQLRWTLASQQDLVELGDFIARDSIVYSIKEVERMIVAAEGLQSNPLMGRVVPEYRREDLRELIVRSYRLVYLVRGPEVIVIRVVHGARDFAGTLGPQPWRLT
jgi:addiction module RelE/StbE family toxin